MDTPEYFLMWRMVSRKWGLKRMRTPGRVCPGGDAVWIWAAAGDLRRAVEVAVALAIQTKMLQHLLITQVEQVVLDKAVQVTVAQVVETTEQIIQIPIHIPLPLVVAQEQVQ